MFKKKYIDIISNTNTTKLINTKNYLYAGMINILLSYYLVCLLMIYHYVCIRNTIYTNFSLDLLVLVVRNSLIISIGTSRSLSSVVIHFFKKYYRSWIYENLAGFKVIKFTNVPQKEIPAKSTWSDWTVASTPEIWIFISY